MSEASDKTNAWRAAKRKAGYLPLNWWAKAETKHAVEAAAFQRRMEPGDLLGEIVRAWQPATAKKAPLLDEARVIALIRAELAGEHQQEPTTTVTEPAPPDDKAALDAQIEELMAQGLKQTALAERLNREGVPSPSGDGKPWTKGRVDSKLRRMRAKKGRVQ